MIRFDFSAAQRPDIDLEPTAGDGRFHLNGDWDSFKELADWSAERLDDGVSDILERRSGTSPGADLSPQNEFNIDIWYESMAADWPRAVAQRVNELGYAPTKAESYVYAKEKGDPSLHSLTEGNGIHFAEFDRAAAERLRE